MVHIEIRPGLITVVDPFFGRHEFNGLILAQLENAVRDNDDSEFLPYQVGRLIPGFDHYYDRLPPAGQHEVARLVENLCRRICNATIAGDLYPLMLLTELASLVARHVENEERERQSE